ncbi:MAG: DUF6702 family protein [Woeseiaceae bacterium]|nr:DUF6702 family protein [Woeseiaceae bacterium]
MRAAPWQAAVLALVAAAATAVAHRAPGSLSTVEFNPQTGSVEIVHRLHLHDAALGVGNVIDEPLLRLDTLESRARVALYVEQRFAIRSDDEPLPLVTIGAEIAGDYLLVYQEHAGRLPARIAVRDDILRDAFDGQVNQVNIADADTVRTLTFAGDDRWKDFEFRRADPD